MTGLIQVSAKCLDDARRSVTVAQREYVEKCLDDLVIYATNTWAESMIGKRYSSHWFGLVAVTPKKAYAYAKENLSTYSYNRSLRALDKLGELKTLTSDELKIVADFVTADIFINQNERFLNSLTDSAEVIYLEPNVYMLFEEAITRQRRINKVQFPIPEQNKE